MVALGWGPAAVADAITADVVHPVVRVSDVVNVVDGGWGRVDGKCHGFAEDAASRGEEAGDYGSRSSRQARPQGASSPMVAGCRLRYRCRPVRAKRAAWRAGARRLPAVPREVKRIPKRLPPAPRF